MDENKYLALLRGINVGGNNIIKMIELKSAFENIGFTNVETYIQSGNVIFRSSINDTEKLTQMIELNLSAKFDYNSKIVLVTAKQFFQIVKQKPDGFGSNPEKYRYDIMFLKYPLKTTEVLQSIKIRENVDEVWPGEDVVYFSRLISKAGLSYLNKLISLPVYKSMTIRNWKTTYRLYEILQKDR